MSTIHTPPEALYGDAWGQLKGNGEGGIWARELREKGKESLQGDHLFSPFLTLKIVIGQN